jgi:hypothetical protein
LAVIIGDFLVDVAAEPSFLVGDGTAKAPYIKRYTDAAYAHGADQYQ